MASKAVRYTQEFKHQMVDLVRLGAYPQFTVKGVRAHIVEHLVVGQAGRA